MNASATVLSAGGPRHRRADADRLSFLAWVPVALFAHMAGAAALTWLWTTDPDQASGAGFGGIAVDLVFDGGSGQEESSGQANGAPVAEPVATTVSPPEADPETASTEDPVVAPVAPVPLAERVPEPTDVPPPAVAPQAEPVDVPVAAPAPNEDVRLEPMESAEPEVLEAPPPSEPPIEETVATLPEPAALPETAAAPAAGVPLGEAAPVVEAEPPETAAADAASDVTEPVATIPWAPPPVRRPAVPASFAPRPATAPPAPRVATVTQPAPAPVQEAAAPAPSGPQAASLPDDPAGLPGEAPAGIAAPGTTGVGADSTGDDYRRSLQAWFERHKTYPPVARSRGIQGQAVIQITIAADGSITASQLTGSSGSSLLDDAVRRMVQAASPVPPIPAALGSGPLTMSLPVVFALR